MRLKRISDVVQSRANLEFLPPELLVIIFKLAHEKSTFPYALASVCKIWGDVVSTVPEFWTQLVVFIDSNSSSSLSNLPSHLEWSRDLLFRITATRRSHSEATDNGERARVRKVMDSLGPHLHRCVSLRLDVIYSSSLPSIYADISHGRVCPKLGTIAFNSRIGDGPGSYFRDDLHNDAQRKEISLPALKSITLDGFNFVDLCNRHHDWFQSIPRAGLKDVSISHFTQSQRSGEHQYSFYDGHVYLKDVTHLKLSSVDFTCVPKGNDTINLSFSKLLALELEDLSSQLTREVLSRCEYVNGVSITRCAVGEISDAALYAFDLILEDIPASGNLPQFLSRWSGAGLTLWDCSGFDDSVLEKWSTRASDAPDSSFYCPLLESLTIHNCPNFSVERLKHLVEVRMEQCQRSGGLELGDPSLSYLKVTGRGPFLSDGDREWFIQNVEVFERWETHQNVF